MGPDLPRKRHDHCLVKVSPNMILLVGGSELNVDIEAAKETFSIDLKGTLEWSTEASLINPRRNAICGLIKDSLMPENKTVVIAGGCYLDSVEFLAIKDQDNLGDQWISGPSMPAILCNGAAATTSDQTRIIVIGGSDSQAIAGLIFQLQCWNGDCQWLKWDRELTQARNDHIAMILPRGAIRCYESKSS